MLRPWTTQPKVMVVVVVPFIILTLYCSSIRQASPLIPRCHLKPHHSLPLLYFKNSKDADFIPGRHLFLWWCIDHCPGCLWIWFLHQLKKTWIAWLWPNGTFVVTALNWSLTLISFLGVVREQENPSLKSSRYIVILSDICGKYLPLYQLSCRLL